MQSVLLSDIFNTSECFKMSIAYVYAEKHLVQVFFETILGLFFVYFCLFKLTLQCLQKYK